jgi:hypothetical protein
MLSASSADPSGPAGRGEILGGQPGHPRPWESALGSFAAYSLPVGENYEAPCRSLQEVKILWPPADKDLDDAGTARLGVYGRIK